ncbi:hypothetical protein U27_06042 [Candidatus Vecturithrix granuli]|uniref:Uncharacterized protein n=1 Tax=Vecturithrix granuli TaxID=1499967 RepID=A0A081C3B1_VECG1|nr:hypothetical protein U27_06042 [Candidatus Vecturithrix granuli]
MKRVIASLVIVASLFTFAGTGLAQQLDARTQQALLDALNDEYKALATYQQVIKQFGEIRPFTNIMKAEQTHVEELLPLFEKYGVAVPENEWIGKIPAFASIEDALKAGVQAEIENAQIYDEFFTFVQEQDVLQVFKQLRDASQDKHLPAFQRGLERGSGLGSGRAAQGQGQGRGQNAQGQGQGQGQGNGNGQGQGNGKN